MTTPLQFKREESKETRQNVEAKVLNLYSDAIKFWQKSKKEKLTEADYSKFRETLVKLHDILRNNPQVGKLLEPESSELKKNRLEKYATVVHDEKGNYDGTAISLLLAEAELQDLKKTVNFNFAQIKIEMDKRKTLPKEDLELINSNLSNMKDLYSKIINSYDKVISLLERRSDLPQEWREKRIMALSMTRKKYMKQQKHDIAMLELSIAAIENQTVRNMWNDLFNSIKKKDRILISRLYSKIEEEVKEYFRKIKQSLETEPQLGTELHGLWLAGNVLKRYI